MAYSDIGIFLNSFNNEIKELEKRFNTDPNHGILISYISMASRIKRITANHLNPAMKEIELIDMHYGERYSIKDLGFHTRQAGENLEYIKHLLKELLALYEEQQEYSKISERWKAAFPSIDKRLKEVNSRLLLIEKILKNEF